MAPACSPEATVRVLIVDDSEDWRDLTEAALRSAGYLNIQTTSSATDAFACLDIGAPTHRETAFDLVLLDIVMPEMDGIEACARIRTDRRYDDTPVIMVTSLADMDSLSSAFAAGANDYIPKPVDRVELVARVRAALKMKDRLERRAQAAR